MAVTPLIVSFVGSSGVGKTTVVESLIPLLRASGLRVGTVKHAPHGHEVDRVGSDSWRYQAAGADAVLLAGAAGAVLFLPPEPQLAPEPPARHSSQQSAADVERIVRLIEVHLIDVDVVLAEGFVPFHDLLVIVHRKDVPAKPAGGEREVWLTVTDEPLGCSVEFSFEALDGVAEQIARQARVGTRERPIRVPR